MPTDEMALPRALPVYLSCGCVRYFTCKPRKGDTLLCVFHNSPVRAISKPSQMPKEVA